MAEHLMAKTSIHKLTQAAVKNAKPGRYADGGGLYLAVGPQSKSWVFRFKLPSTVSSRGKPLSREMGIGSVADIGLAAAREKARRLRELVHRKPEDGGPVDPLDQRQAAKAEQAVARAKGVPTFRDMAEAYLAAHAGSWKNAKHAAQWPSTLTAYVYPTLGSLPIKAIDQDLVAKTLAPIWHTKPETARRVRARIQTVIEHAIARKIFDGGNPATLSQVTHLLGRQTDSVQNFKALPYRQMYTFMQAVRAHPGVAAQALEFLVLTATRSGETLQAPWSEIDWQTKIWPIPGARRKGRKGKEQPLDVPLSSRCMEILTAAAERTGGTGLIFGKEEGKRKGKPLSENALSGLVKELGFDCVPHGFRSSFRDWAGDCTHAPREIAEAALGHKIKGVEADYRRGSAIEKRRKLMQDWAKFVDQPWVERADNVVQIGAA